jgi:hypothetical protein
VLNYLPHIEIILDSALKSDNKKIISKGCQILKNAIWTMVEFDITEINTHLPSYLQQHPIDHFQLRGGVKMFTDTKDLEVNWHVPNAAEISAVEKLMDKYLYNSIAKISNYSGDDRNSLTTSLHVITCAFKGISSIVPGSNSEFGEFGCFPVSSGYEVLDIPSKFKTLREDICKVLLELIRKNVLGDDVGNIRTIIKLFFTAMCFNTSSYVSCKSAKAEMAKLRREIMNPLLPKKEQNGYLKRSYQLIRTQLQHKIRSSLITVQQVLTPTYKEVFWALIELCLNRFKTIRNDAQLYLTAASMDHFLDMKYFIKDLYSYLFHSISEATQTADQEETKERVKGALDVMNNQLFFSAWATNIDANIQKAIETLFKCQAFNDNEIQNKVFSFITFFLSIFTPPSLAQIENGNINLAVMFILDCVENAHWRYKVYGLVFIITIIAATSDLEVLNRVSSMVARCLLDEHSFTRQMALGTLNYILKHRKTLLITKSEKVKISPGDYNPVTRYLNLNHPYSNQPLEVKSVSYGWSNSPYSGKLYTYIHPPIPHDYLHEIINDSSLLDQLLNYSYIDHSYEAENADSNPLSQIASMSSAFITLGGLQNMEGIFSYLLFESPQKSKKVWESEFFEPEAAKFYKGIAEQYGPAGCELLMKKAEEFVEKEKEYQAISAEIISGIVAGSKRWEIKGYRERVGSIFNRALEKATLEEADIWYAAIVFMTLDRDPMEMEWLMDAVLENPGNFTSTMRQQKALKSFLPVILGSWRWKSGKALEVVNFFKDISEDCIATLRNHISELISVITPCTSQYLSPPELSSLSDSPLSAHSIDNSRTITSYNPIQDYITYIKTHASTTNQKLLVLTVVVLVISNSWICYQSLPYLLPHLDFIIQCLEDQDTNVISFAKDTLSYTSVQLINRAGFREIQTKVISYFNHENWRIALSALEFLQLSWFYNQFDVDLETQAVVKMLWHSVPEVRAVAVSFLSVIYRLYPNQFVVDHGDSFKALLMTPASSENFVQERLAGCLGLSAMVEAYPYDLPDWMPSVLHALSRLKNSTHSIKQVVKQTISSFWKTHKPWWDKYEFYKSKFNEAQLDAIESMTSEHNYFA